MATGQPSFDARPGSSGRLIFWVSRRDRGTGEYLAYGQLSHAVAVDAHGCEFTSGSYFMVHAPNWSAGGRPMPQPPAGASYILYSGELPAFPRRQKDFVLRLYRPSNPLSWVNSRSAIRSVQFRLCTNESAWKLKATFFPHSAGPLRFERDLGPPSACHPRRRHRAHLTGSNTWQGVTVNLCAIAGPGDITYSNGVPVRVAPWSGGRSGSSSGRVIGGAQVSDVSVATDKSQFMIRVAGLREEARSPGVCSDCWLDHRMPRNPPRAATARTPPA